MVHSIHPFSLCKCLLLLHSTYHSAFMSGISLVIWESCCIASWCTAFTLLATQTVYCRGRSAILGNDCKQNCCLLSSPSCRGWSLDTSTATPAWQKTGKTLVYWLIVSHLIYLDSENKYKHIWPWCVEQWWQRRPVWNDATVPLGLVNSTSLWHDMHFVKKVFLKIINDTAFWLKCVPS